MHILSFYVVARRGEACLAAFYLKISTNAFTSTMTSSSLAGQICSIVSLAKWVILCSPVALRGIAGTPRNENVEWLLSGHGATQIRPGNFAATDLIFASSSGGRRWQ
jgi:hypothetical protein